MTHDCTLFLLYWHIDVSILAVSASVDLNCSFERHFCQWKNGGHQDSKFAWIRNRGETITSKTGPSYDHTYQNPDSKENEMLHKLTFFMP